MEYAIRLTWECPFQQMTHAIQYNTIFQAINDDVSLDVLQKHGFFLSFFSFRAEITADVQYILMLQLFGKAIF